jgi:hypothetical protein
MDQLFSFFFLTFGSLCFARGQICISGGEGCTSADEYVIRGTRARALSLLMILGSMMLLSKNQWGLAAIGLSYLIAISIPFFNRDRNQ